VSSRQYDDDDDRPARPRRPRDDDDYERRPRRDSFRNEPPAKRASVLGILSLIQGIGGLLVSLIPCIGALGMIGGAIGLLLGVIGLVSAKKSGGTVGTGLPTSGIIVSVIGIVIGGVWLLVMSAMFSGGPSGGNTPTTGSEDSPAHTLSASDLDKEYEQNEAAADGKYKGHWVEITGSVERVSNDERPSRVRVELSGSRGSTVDCLFSTTKKAELGKLVIGESVTIRGKCKGRDDGLVTLENCVRVTKEKDPAEEPKPGKDIRVSATELLKAYLENEIAADTKYKNKMLEVNGKVARVARIKPGKVTVEIQSDDGGLLLCDFLAKEGASLGSLKAGQQVIIRGKCLGNEDGVVTMENCSVVK
jgi:hypothetical protein